MWPWQLAGQLVAVNLRPGQSALSAPSRDPPAAAGGGSGRARPLAGRVRFFPSPRPNVAPCASGLIIGPGLANGAGRQRRQRRPRLPPRRWRWRCNADISEPGRAGPQAGPGFKVSLRLPVAPGVTPGNLKLRCTHEERHADSEERGGSCGLQGRRVLPLKPTGTERPGASSYQHPRDEGGGRGGGGVVNWDSKDWGTCAQ